MLTVHRTLAIVADGLQIIYGDEAQTIAHFALRQCRERHDTQGERVWNEVLARVRTGEGLVHRLDKLI